jgi:iron(III) transport system permease protein
MRAVPRSLTGWLALAMASLLLLPWHQQEAGFWAFEWLAAAHPLGEAGTASALLQVLRFARPELQPLLLLVPLATLMAALPIARTRRGLALCAVALAALGWLAWLGWGGAFGNTPGLGWGALLFAAGMLFVFSTGAAWLGACRGDVFVCGVIALLVALVGLFVLLPVMRVMAGAFESNGGFALGAAAMRLADARAPGRWAAWPAGRAAASPGTRSSWAP